MTREESTTPSETLDLAPESRPAERPKGFWKKMKRGLFMTHTEVIEKIDAALEGKETVDEETLEYLEESLIAADLGVETSLELVERLRADVRRGEAGDVVALKQRLVDEISVLLLDAPKPPPAVESRRRVTLVVGVNGVGKTTSIAKLAHRYRRRGRSVLMAAADTFRAAAIEQLTLWGERLDVDVVRQRQGSDPAAVVYDALQAARARDVEEVLVDTAGRLHNKEHLMRELDKIGRVVEREAEDHVCRTLLVLDATTGHNALEQARQFKDVVDVDGVLLAKVDGTAKGGIVVAIARDLRLPVLYLGVGETPEDLVEFHPRDFAEALIAS